MISVIIPNHNNATFILESIKSALSQEHVSEVIVIDDASTDDSVVLVETLAQKDNRLLIIKTKKDQAQGAAYSRNLGLDNAKGKYIAFLDSDDIYLANRFEKAIMVLDKNQSIHGVYDDVWSYNESFDKRDPSFDICMPQDVDPSQLLEHLIFNGKTFISIIGLILRSDVAKRYRMDFSLQIGEDSDYIWRLAQNHQLVHSGQYPSLIQRRVHSNNITKNKKLWDESRVTLYSNWYDYSRSENLSLSVIGHFWRKKIHYKGKSKGLLQNPYKAVKYFIDIIKQPKLLTYLLNI